MKQHADFAKGATVAEAAAMREAIKTGQAPVIQGAPQLAQNAAALLEAQARLDIAEAALSGLVSEEQSAEGALAGAKEAVKRAVKACVLEES